MKPIDPLMMEHRLIERMMNILGLELDIMEKFDKIHPVILENAVDFIRSYADQTHNLKEESILYRELKKKELSVKDERILNELIEEHKTARQMTKELAEVNTKYIQGHFKSIAKIFEKLEFLIEFYPRLLKKEENHLLNHVMKYFTDEEQTAMLEEGRMYDRKMIHKKYQNLVKNYEEKREIPPNRSESEWIDYF